MSPITPMTNARYGRLSYSEPQYKFGILAPGFHKLFHSNYLFVCKLGCWMALTTLKSFRVNSGTVAISKCKKLVDGSVSGVFLSGAPFQIANSIVRFYAINVINFISVWCWHWQEMTRNKACDLKAELFAFLGEKNPNISFMIKLGLFNYIARNQVELRPVGAPFYTAHIRHLVQSLVAPNRQPCFFHGLDIDTGTQ